MKRSLSNIALLAGLTASERTAIAERCLWRQAEPGEVILSHGDPSRDVFFIAAGRVAIMRISANGRPVQLAEIDAGGPFGELAALDGRERSASIVAIHPTVTSRMTRDKFRRMLSEHPVVAEAVIMGLVAEVRRLAQKIDELSTLTVPKRLVAELLRLARPSPEGAIISPPPRHVDLAARIGTHREAVTKELAKLEECGAICRNPRRFLLRDTDAMRTAVEKGSLS